MKRQRPDPNEARIERQFYREATMAFLVGVGRIEYELEKIGFSDEEISRLGWTASTFGFPIASSAEAWGPYWEQLVCEQQRIAREGYPDCRNAMDGMAETLAKLHGDNHPAAVSARRTADDMRAQQNRRLQTADDTDKCVAQASDTKTLQIDDELRLIDKMKKARRSILGVITRE